MRSWEPGRLGKIAAMLAIVFATSEIWSACAAFYGHNTRVVLFLVYAPALYGGLCVLWWVIGSARAREKHLVERLKREIDAGHNLCLTAIESLAFAVEGRTSHNLGHLARVQTYCVETARALGLPAENLDGMRVAALVHDIGRLGVPDNILAKGNALTEEERDKVRAYPVLGSRLLASIPFPWPIADIVRHHREHFDGSGYPDGLRGEAVPIEARILAVADTFDALVSGGAQRDAVPPRTALAQLQALAGTQFDPLVLAAFAEIVDGVHEGLYPSARRIAAHGASHEIAKAQREVQALYDLACSAGATLHLDEVLERLAERIGSIVSSTTRVFFLNDEDDEWLIAAGAFGVNQAFYRRSRARVGTYLTGRVVSRGEPVIASYMPDDIDLRHSLEMWTPLRSTLIVPMVADERVIGTINLYHTEPEAFEPDDLRVMLFVGELAGRAIQNARLFAETHESANTDPVTGLRNRRFLRQFLDQELNRACKNDLSLAVLGLDLDRFKPVNDQYGHERGDQILREVAQVLRSLMRNYDLVSRYAGDEFAIVLPDTSREEADVVAAKVTAAIDHYTDRLIAQDRHFPRIGVSIGVAIFPDDAADITTLLQRADAQMYDRKRSRREERAA